MAARSTLRLNSQLFRMNSAFSADFGNSRGVLAWCPVSTGVPAIRKMNPLFKLRLRQNLDSFHLSDAKDVNLSVFPFGNHFVILIGWFDSHLWTWPNIPTNNARIE